jgi:hypothetical protein
MFDELLDLYRKLGADEVSLTVRADLIEVVVRKKVSKEVFSMGEAFSRRQLAYASFRKELLVEMLVDKWRDAVSNRAGLENDQ